MKAGKEYLRALAAVISRVEKSLAGAPPAALPVRMYIAGGAALHLLAGGRVSEDIDAVFSRRVLLSDDLQVSYRDADGRARLLYVDRNYNDTLGLMHENAYRDSRALEIEGVDASVLEPRLLSPLDLAVTKLARFSGQDREDLELLARRRLIDAASLRKRAEEALGGYVGDLAALRGSIDAACQLVGAIRKT